MDGGWCLIDPSIGINLAAVKKNNVCTVRKETHQSVRTAPNETLEIVLWCNLQQVNKTRPLEQTTESRRPAPFTCRLLGAEAGYIVFNVRTFSFSAHDINILHENTEPTVRDRS